jgi:hypothetical protein
MSAVVDFVEDVVGGVVEAVGDVVDTVVDVVKDVGRAVDDYVIQPILDDPLTAIATVAGAYFLGPAAASYFGTSAAIGAGVAAGSANAAAGLVQGEDFDEAIKGGLIAGATTWAGAELSGLGDTAAASPDPQFDTLDDLLAANNNFDPSIGGGVAPPSTPQVTVPPAGSSYAPASEVPFDLASAATEAPASTLAPPAPAAPSPNISPLESLSAPGQTFTPDYDLSSGIKPASGVRVPNFTAADSIDIFGNPNYGLAPPGTSGGPGIQMPTAPNLASMGGGQGVTVDVQGLPEFRYADGTTDTWLGDNGKVYGRPTPDVTISETAITPTSPGITYPEMTPPPTLVDKAVDWATANPWTAAGIGLSALGALGSPGAPDGPPPQKGSTQDANFTKSLDLYDYQRDRANYGDDLTRYGQVGQSKPGEHQFFQNTRFVPIPIPAKMGGLIQMKHYAQGGQVDGMQDPRQAQMMQAMARQQGSPQMPAFQGRPPMMQGGALPGRAMMPQNAQGMQQQQGRPPMMQQQQGRPPMMQGGLQGMQQARQQMPQRPKDPRMAYYQYGNAPQARAEGGLSRVQSMQIGGGADGRSDDVNALLSDGEYVFDAEAVAMLGNGSSEAGAKKLDDMRAKLRQHKGKALAGGKISPDAKSPLSYLKGA